MNHAPEPKPFVFQRPIIDLLASTSRFAMYLALEQGLGKTMVVLLAAHKRGVSRMLVLGPAIACLVWEHEVRKWLPPSVNVMWVREARKMPHGPACGSGLTICVVSYDTISRHPEAWQQAIAGYDPQLVVLDEAHRLKSSDANVTRAVYGPRCDGKGGIIEHAQLLWACSGTPCPNSTPELWTYLRACAPDLITSVTMGLTRPLEEHEFQERFGRIVHGDHGPQIVGSRNTDQLRGLIAKGFIRRTKAQVLRHFPPVRYVTTPIELRAQLPDIFGWDNGLNHVPDEELLPRLEAMASDSMLPLSSARRELGMRKVRSIIEWVNAWLADSDPSAKLLLFAIHRDVIDVLHNVLLNAKVRVPNIVKIDGRTPPQARVDAVNTFQHEAACRLFLGQIVAAGEVITLTAASTVAICEAEFVPARIAQAAARAHRIGQRNAVLVHLLSVPDSLDIRVNRIAARKAQELTGLFDTDNQGSASNGDGHLETGHHDGGDRRQRPEYYMQDRRPDLSSGQSVRASATGAGAGFRQRHARGDAAD